MKSDEQFMRLMESSNRVVHDVAAWMVGQKCDVMIRPVVLRPCFESRGEYADDGDIEIRQRVEVKHKKVEFTCEEDYPYHTVMIDEVYKIDRIPRSRLWGYLIVNADATHLCWVNPATKSKWDREFRYDRRDERDREFYLCPKSLCTFFAMKGKNDEP